MTVPVHPYRSGVFAPVEGELREEVPLQVIEGQVPKELFGDFLRNGPNPRFEPEGRYHWFDGDGMVHRVRFENGTARYTRRFLQTEAFRAESAAGRSLWGSSTERPDFARQAALGLTTPFKNTANTDIVFHQGKVLAFWWLAGQAYALDAHTLDTLGPEEFGAQVRSISAHPKRDPRSGELLYFDYQSQRPFLSTGIIAPDGVRRFQTEVPLDGPRLQHDMAFTERHVLLFDMALQWDPDELQKGRTKVGVRRNKPSRIGVLRRGAPGETIRWFETDPFYMYHAINASETEEAITLWGCRILNPVADPSGGETVPTIGFLRIEPTLHRWTLNLRTGGVHHEALDDRLAEFPRMDDRFAGGTFRYAVLPTLAREEPTLLFDGLDVHDFQAGNKDHLDYGAGRFGGELVFAPRSATAQEWDGWLVTLVAERGREEAEVWVVEANQVSRGPVARLRIPFRVPIGFHADWAPGWALPARTSKGMRQGTGQG